MEKSESNKKPGETIAINAYPGMLPNEQIEKRNKLFDLIVENRVGFVALLRDDDEKNLFRGQVGEIQQVELDGQEKKDFYFLEFIDFENGEGGFGFYLVEKNNLLPLFSSDPEEDRQIEIVFQNLRTLHDIRNRWEELQVQNVSTLELKRHNKVASQFDIGRLVTIQFDFEQEGKIHGEETSFIIQAGQVGIISKEKIIENNDDIVEVTFLSLLFGKLARERQDLVFSSTSSKGRKILIGKNFLLPLYCEQCEELD